MPDQVRRLILVESQDEWNAYHSIRRQILFGDGYDANHPDDRAEKNHPVLFELRGTPIGAMRIDLVPEADYAIMRTVAILESFQRQGHGTSMLSMAEDYAADHGRSWAVTIADNAAVPFYEKCGYESYNWDPGQVSDDGRQMRKLLTSRCSRRGCRESFKR